MNSAEIELHQALAHVRDVASRARLAARHLARTPDGVRQQTLQAMAQSLRAHTDRLLQANARDVLRAGEAGRDAAFIDRLTLSAGRIGQMARAIEDVALLPDPLGAVDQMWTRPNGIRVGKKRIPLGVVGIIYEARPNVTSDAAALCLRSGNAVVLKGGSDALDSNRAVIAALHEGLRQSPLPPEAWGALGFVDSADRDAVREMLTLERDIDVIIPRGGKALIGFVNEHSRIPVIKHDEGVCHLVVDGSARPEDVDRIALNAKTQRPGVCNAIETLLVLESAVTPHLARLLACLAHAGVRLHLCPRSLPVACAQGLDEALLTEATDAAYHQEFLALELAVRVVPDLDAAIAHIETYGSRHTESLVTQDYAQSQRFLDEVDSSVVMVNASTRFSDGGELGLGAEIGISTTRLHAYGPMGLKELTTTKFIVLGDGQVRS